MNDEILNGILINHNASIKETMRRIDKNGLGIAFVIDENKKLIGVVTDGDIRRAILNGITVDEPVTKIMNNQPVTVKNELTEIKIKKLLSDENIVRKIPIRGSLKIPILDDDGRVKNIAFLRENAYRSKVIYTHPIKEKSINKILIVGGAGYLGSVLTRKLLDMDYKVRILDSLVYGDIGVKEFYENEHFELIKGDMRDIQIVVEAIKDMDAVIHLAAIVGDPASALNPEETIEINYLATKMLAEVCKYNQINRFIFASTCSVYGASENPEEILDENSPLNPVSLYAQMKLKSEQGILELMDENFSPTIFRMATLYGPSPRMRFDLAVNLLTAKATVDREITIFGGDQWRPFLHVEDAAEAYIKCLEAPIDKIRGKIFNVGSTHQNYQINEIGEIIKTIIPEAEIVYNKKDTDKRNYRVSFRKIENELGYITKYEVKDGVMQIHRDITNGKFGDYTDPKYSNYKFLKEQYLLAEE